MLKVKHETNDVITIKIMSGEEIIGYYHDSTPTTLTLRRPMVPVATGEGTVGLAPYIMSSNYLHEGDGLIPFNLHSIITQVPTSDQFANVYTQMASGIDMSASKKSGLIL